MAHAQDVITGTVLIVLAAGFFLYMTMLAPKSTDPAKLMQIVGEVSGVVGAIAVLMIAFGLIGRRA